MFKPVCSRPALACASLAFLAFGLSAVPLAGGATKATTSRPIATASRATGVARGEILRSSIQPGTYSGVIKYAESGVTVNGSWSMTVAGSGQVTGLLNVDSKVTLPGGSGCTVSTPDITFEVHGTFSGSVQGANVVGVWRDSGGFSPSTISSNCGGTVTNTPMPSIPLTSHNTTFPLGQLSTGGSQTIPGVGAFTLTKKPSGSGGLTTPTASATTPPAIAPPSTPLPAVTAPAPKDSCKEVRSSSGQIDICVPSWLSGSSSPGTTYLDSSGTAHSFTGELPPGDTLKTGSGQYADLTVPGTTSSFALSPNSTAVEEPGYRNGRTLSICEQDPENCLNDAAFQMSRAASGAMDSAMTGNLPLAWLKIANGVDDLEDNAFKSVRKAAEILSSPNVYIAPSETTVDQGKAHLARTTAAPTNVEVSVKSSGTTLYVVSGSCVVVNTASGGFITVTAGHELTIPNSSASARAENMKTSVHSFNVSSLKKWWK